MQLNVRLLWRVHCCGRAPVSNLVESPSSPLSETIEAAIARLRSLSQVSVQPGWRFWAGDLPLTTALNPDNWATWAEGAVNAKDHHPWVKGRQVQWFARRITVPADLQGYPLTGMCLRLELLWWSEDTQVYVNGQLVQEGDLFDCAPRILLSPAVQPGDTFAIALRMVSPIHDDGALMKSICHYEALTPDAPLEPAFIANELAVLHSFLVQFQPEKLATLAAAIAQLDWDTLDGNGLRVDQPFTRSLTALRHNLMPLAEPLKQRQIKLLGHAHLDMAWLWSVAETWIAAERTFRSVLNLQADFPELTFAHTTPALYEWMEQQRPDVFAQIQEQVKAGKWEIVAGFWIEPELNLISGESIVRQVLYGQRYIQEKFGQRCAIAWVPDTFGFTWQVPQILKQGGVDYFVTQKLRWNDTTQFPHEVFWWQAPDGTRILSLMSAPIGEFITPVKMANFTWELERKTGLQTALWLPGVGDHGGGPTRDMVEVAQRWQQSPFFPQMEWGTALEYLEAVGAEGNPSVGMGHSSRESNAQRTDDKGQAPDKEQAPSPIASLPIWNSELYLEYHRGCYTTHADQKRRNREAENLLYGAELLASLANITTGTPYPKTQLEELWKITLFNQFHDILPGSSITQVFEEANQQWQEVDRIGYGILNDSLEAIAAQIAFPPSPHPNATPLIVFNPTNWERTEVVDLMAMGSVVGNWENESPCRICDLNGQDVEFYAYGRYLSRGNRTSWRISFLAKDIPPIGYRCFWFYCKTPEQDTAPQQVCSFVLENDFLRATVDPVTGDLASIYDKQNQREVLSGSGNQLQAFEDKGQYWDAWNIDPDYHSSPLKPCELVSIDHQFFGSLETRIRVKRKIGNSTFTQVYALEKEAPILKIENFVNWEERHTLVKAAFPLNLEADFATYEIPCGAIQRTTKPQTEAEKAQWEVPAMRWADLSDGTYGVSLLNDCKYGYDATPNQLRLTLLRGSEWPDPEADEGYHEFTYAIYPHAGDWKQAQTVRKGYELNLPLHVVELGADKIAQAGTLPPVASLLDLGDENLVLMAFKQAEDSENEWILRCYECHGQTAELQVQSELGLKVQAVVDGLEQPLASTEPEPKNQGQTITIRPWEIVSIKLSTP